LPKTTAWFKQTAYKKAIEETNQQNSSSSSSSSSFEFYRFNSFTNSTQANMRAIFYGNLN